MHACKGLTVCETVCMVPCVCKTVCVGGGGVVYVYMVYKTVCVGLCVFT